MFPLSKHTVALLLCAASLPAAALTLDEALAAARNFAPDLSASRAAEAAAHSLTLSAGQLPDPKLSLTLDQLPLEGDERYQTSQSMRSIGLMQEFPNSAKREAERQIATAQWQASSAQNQYAGLNVRRSTTLAWLTLYYLQQKTRVLDQQTLENQNSLAVSKSELAAGGSPGAALAAQLETQQIADARDDLNSSILQARAILARWTGPEVAKQAISGPLPEWKKAATADQQQFDQQPELHAAGSQITAARAGLALAEAGKQPDWALELALQRTDMGDNKAMIKLSFDLPFFTTSRQNPKIAAAMAEMQRAEAERDIRKAGFLQQYAELQAQDEAIAAQLQRLKNTTLPLIRRQGDLALASFKSGKGSSSAVLEARQLRLQAELRAIDLESRFSASQAQLYFLTTGHAS